MQSFNLGVPDGYGEGPLFLTGESQTGNTWGTALTLGADSSFITPKSPFTTTSTAVDVMTPTTEGINTLSDFWKAAGSVFLDVTKATSGYLIAKDASKNAVLQPTQQQPVYVQAQPGGQQIGGLLPLLLIGGLIFLAVKD